MFKLLFYVALLRLGLVVELFWFELPDVAGTCLDELEIEDAALFEVFVLELVVVGVVGVCVLVVAAFGVEVDLGALDVFVLELPAVLVLLSWIVAEFEALALVFEIGTDDDLGELEFFKLVLFILSVELE